MRIILNEDIVSLGVEGDIVNVADGYARNYLIPKGLAIIASEGNLKNLEMRRRSIEKKETARVKDAKKEAKKFDGKKIKAIVKVSEEGKLYGSVSVSEIAALIKEQLKEELDKRQIVLHDSIKEVGDYSIVIRLHPQVEATIALEVIGEEMPETKMPEETVDEKEKKRKKKKEVSEEDQAKKEEVKIETEAEEKEVENTEENTEEKIEEETPEEVVEPEKSQKVPKKLKESK